LTVAKLLKIPIFAVVLEGTNIAQKSVGKYENGVMKKRVRFSDSGKNNESNVMKKGLKNTFVCLCLKWFTVGPI